MACIKDFLNLRRAEGEEVFDYEEGTVTLEQVMALCVEVEERAALKANPGVPAPVVNTVNIQACHYCGKPGHKYRMCRHKDTDKANGIELPPTAKRQAFQPRTPIQGATVQYVPSGSGVQTTEPVKQVTFGGTTDKEVVKCYKCGGQGHLMSLVFPVRQ